ncbi:MAG: PTS sugar transporter subunit IIA [Acidobacteria bacterium]|nr:PTS sugar transporter subunit IIA [Acidobacteriota bacterium]
MRLDSLTRPDLVFPGLPGTDASTLLRALATEVADSGAITDGDTLYERLLEREELSSTGIGRGVAVPHCKLRKLDQVLLAIGISDRAVDFAAIDKKPVRLFFLVVSPDDQPAAHLKVLAAISKWVQTERRVERIVELKDRQEIFDLLGPEELG